MKKILVFADYYYPGFKAGGPIQSILNLVLCINIYFDVYVVSRDRDSGEIKPYSDINYGHWNKIKQHNVRYLSPKEVKFKVIQNIINEISPNIIYLNSFFSTFSVYTIFNSLINSNNIPIVISPRGELFESAIKIKYLKKSIYILLYNLLFAKTTYIYFIASNKKENNTIKNKLGGCSNIVILNNLARNSQPEKYHLKTDQNNLKFISLSRVHPIKNLKFFAYVLKEIQTSKIITWDIFGYIELENYKREIENLLINCSNINVKFYGPIPNHEVPEIIANYDFFVHPSLSENFGHSIYDSILSGTPLILSKNTPWNNIYEYGIGYDLELNINQWTSIINELLGFSLEKINSMKIKTYMFGNDLLNDQTLKKDYITFFNKLI